jgi:Ca2+-binding RTX toxin-like protein
MMHAIFDRLFTNGARARAGGKRIARSRRISARVEGLETRNLLTAGTVVQTGGLVTVMPSSTGPNVAIVSYQTVNGSKMLDVNLNGTNNDFSLTQVGFVYYEGSNISGSQTFENETSLHTVAWGGSGTNLFVSGGSAQDEFFGGSGSNTFDAGSGYDVLVGGTGANVFNEGGGSGVILPAGNNNTINVPHGSAGNYQVL